MWLWLIGLVNYWCYFNESYLNGMVVCLIILFLMLVDDSYLMDF